MYLVIRKNAKDFYYSECFGILKQDRKEKFIVLNSDYTNLILTEKYFYYRDSQEDKKDYPPYAAKKCILIDTNRSNWVEANDNLQGYDFIVNNDTIMKKLLNNEQLDNNIITQAKEINEKYVLSEWHNLQTEYDINNINQLTFHFHDAELKKIIKDENSTTFIFDNWGFLVYLKCDKESCRYNLKVEDICSSGEIIKTEKGFKFTAFEEFYGEVISYYFIESNSMQWKIELLPLPNKTWSYIENSKDLN